MPTQPSAAPEQAHKAMTELKVTGPWYSQPPHGDGKVPHWLLQDSARIIGRFYFEEDAALLAHYYNDALVRADQAVAYVLSSLAVEAKQKAKAGRNRT
jgi:hypothetical protein